VAVIRLGLLVGHLGLQTTFEIFGSVVAAKLASHCGSESGSAAARRGATG
jgi:hypothetical protein